MIRFAFVERGLERLTDQHVYFFERPHDGAIKIGISATPRKRLSSVGQQAACLAVWPGAGRYFEKQLHEHFAADRLDGEWFKPTDELLTLIEGVQCCFPYVDHEGATVPQLRKVTA